MARPRSRPKPEDIEKAAHELHEIQERWKQVAEAPRAQAQALWHRYRQAADPIQARAREFFAQRAEERGANLEAQDGADRARRSARRLDRLDQDRRRAEEAAGRMAADRRRSRVRTPKSPGSASATRAIASSPAATPTSRERKETWTANLAQEGSALRPRRGTGASREWDKAAAEIRRLQAEWKTIGPVRRSKSEAIWQRFRAACDTFFERYKRRDEIELEAKHADREALVVELETLRRHEAGASRKPGRPRSSASARCARAGTRRRRSSGRAPIR